MSRNRRFQVAQAPRRRVADPVHSLCLVFLLALLLAGTLCFAEKRDEVCAAMWHAPACPVRLCRKSKREAEDVAPRDMPPGTVVWIYLRHSPGDNQTLESQEAAVMNLVRGKGWIVGRVFRDRWTSGKSTENREAFELMIHLARQKPRPADLLIIWEFGRFARNQDDAQFYTAELRMNGWHILSMNDDIPSGSMGRIFEAMIHWKNEQFLIDLRANTLRGLRFIAEQGCVPVGPVGKGYTFREVQIATYQDGTPRMGRKPEPDPQVAPLVIKAFEMKARGAPNTAISRETGLYSPNSGSWNHFFRNRVYIGEYEFRGEVFTNIYPPLVSQELCDAVQKHVPRHEKKMKGRHHPRRKGSSYFLVNVAVCAYCWGRMEGKSANGRRYYICAHHNKQADLCPEAGPIPADSVEEETLHTLLSHVLTAERLQALCQWTNDNLNSGLDELKLRLDKTQVDLADAERLALKMARNFGTMEAPSRTAERLLREQDDLVHRLQNERAELEHELANSRIEALPEEIEQYVRQARALIGSGEFFDLREACEQLCSRVVMGRAECQLEVHFPAL